MTYNKQTWNAESAGGTPLSDTRFNYMEQGIADAHALIAGVTTGGSTSIGIGQVLVDSLTSSTDDDDMLLAAAADHKKKLGDSSTTSLAPTYRLGLRRYTFSQTFFPPNGFSLRGCGWLQNSVVASSTHPSSHTQVKLAMPNPGGLSSIPWIDGSQTTAASGGATWDANFGDFNIYSDTTYATFARAPFIGSSQQGFRECGFYNIVAQNLYSVFGTKAEGCAMTICDVSGGGWQIAESRAQAVTIQGSDNNEIFADGCDFFNIGHTSATAPQNVTGKEEFMCELRSLGKSGFGPAYFTARNGFRALKITGSSASFGLVLRGTRIEGNNNNPGQECNGALLRIEGGTVSATGLTIDDGMASPSFTTAVNNNGQPDHGLVEILGSSVVSLRDLHVAHGNTPAVTTPIVYASGAAEVYVQTALRGVRGKSWGTQKPVVSGAPSGGLNYDNSVQFV